MTAHTVKQCQAWHETTSLGLHARSDDVGCGMSSPPLDNTHGRMTSGETCHHRLWTAHTVEPRRACHAIIAFGQHTRSNDIGRGMPSSPLGSTNGQTTPGVTCHPRLWTTYTIERRRAWHAIIAFWQHTQLNDVGCGMTSPPLDNTYGRMMSDVKCHNHLWTAHSVE